MAQYSHALASKFNYSMPLNRACIDLSNLGFILLVTSIGPNEAASAKVILPVSYAHRKSEPFKLTGKALFYN
jgi:hypothetical protein